MNLINNECHADCNSFPNTESHFIDNYANNYEFASKSVESKKVERYTACVDAFNSMKANYPYSRLLSESQKIADEAAAKIKKINNKQESKISKRRKNNED